MGFIWRHRWAFTWLLACLIASFALTTKITVDVFSDVDAFREHVAEWLIAASVGFAFALLTAHLVELESRRQTEQDRNELKEMQKEILNAMQDSATALVAETANSIGKSVFGAMYSKEVFDKTIESIFSTPLIRKDFHHKIVFEYGNVDTVLKITQTMEYTMVNSSSLVDAVFDARIVFDDASNMYPPDIGYEPEKLKYVEIDGNIFTVDRIDEINRSSKKFPSTYDIQYLSTLGTYIIPKNLGSIKVLLITESQEPRDGQWVTSTYYPLDGLTVDILNEVTDLNIFLISIGKYEFDEAVYPFSTTQKSWTRSHRGVLLANSGWNIRWNVSRRTTPPPLTLSTAPATAPDTAR